MTESSQQGKIRSQTDTTLVWFRQDLRIQDNPALFYAAAKGKVLPVYILDDKHSGRWKQGGASRWWLHQSLAALNESLGGALRFFKGDPLRLIPELLGNTGINQIIWNRCYQPWQIQRDSALKSALKNQGVDVQTRNGSLLWEPQQILKKDGNPYKVFTPYFRNGCLKHQEPRYPLPVPPSLEIFSQAPKGEELDQLDLMPKWCWYRSISSQWKPGETGAGNQLARFVSHHLNNYKQGRDRPDKPGTSKLSPHLHFGELSPNQIWYLVQNCPLASDNLSQTSNNRARTYNNGESIYGDSINRDSIDSFIRELGWREFSYYLLYHFPTLPLDNFQPKFDHFPWRNDPKMLNNWQQGKTGIPMVDAGMRELWQTGYMHNRVRMIVGSFLVKNLRLRWHLGQDWFWDTLVDADMASNSASWQWVAGSGADAAPYFRIFNPVNQGQKFDPDGLYVKRFCPELSQLPSKYIHCPWMASPALLSQSGITLGSTYPKPIVDLKISRQQALDAFASLKDTTLLKNTDI